MTLAFLRGFGCVVHISSWGYCSLVSTLGAINSRSTFNAGVDLLPHVQPFSRSERTLPSAAGEQQGLPTRDLLPDSWPQTALFVCQYQTVTFLKQIADRVRSLSLSSCFRTHFLGMPAVGTRTHTSIQACMKREFLTCLWSESTLASLSVQDLVLKPSLLAA